MQFIENLTEHDMIAVFLQAELHSDRFGTDIRRLLDRDRMPYAILDHPDTTNASENTYRFQLFGEFRGYGRNERLFQDFPKHVIWQRVKLNCEELLQVKYIDYDYWVALSGGTRLARDAADAIRAGRTVFNVPSDGFLRIAHALRQGVRFAELILVRASEQADVVVLEGHVRLTVYALVPEAIPPELPVLLGTSSEFVRWGLYGSGEPPQHP